MCNRQRNFLCIRTPAYCLSAAPLTWVVSYIGEKLIGHFLFAFLSDQKPRSRVTPSIAQPNDRPDKGPATAVRSCSLVISNLKLTRMAQTEGNCLADKDIGFPNNCKYLFELSCDRKISLHLNDRLRCMRAFLNPFANFRLLRISRFFRSPEFQSRLARAHHRLRSGHC